MAMSRSKVTADFLDAFAAAWNRHDVDAILSMMTPDCVFEASRGPEVKGTVYVGQEEARRGIEEVFATFPDAQWNSLKHFIAGDRGVSEWVFTGTDPSGFIEVHVPRREDRGQELLQEVASAARDSVGVQIGLDFAQPYCSAARSALAWCAASLSDQ